MKDLALLTGESVKLFIIEDKKRICLARELGPSRLHYALREGEILSLLAGAGGKVLMAYVSPEFRDEILAQGLERVTPSTIVKREQWLEDFAAVRAQGYVVSKGELVYEVGGIAGPVFNNDRKVVPPSPLLAPFSVSPTSYARKTQGPARSNDKALAAAWLRRGWRARDVSGGGGYPRSSVMVSLTVS